MNSGIIIIIVLQVVAIIVFLAFRGGGKDGGATLHAKMDEIQLGLKQDFLLNRTEAAQAATRNRAELSDALNSFGRELNQAVQNFNQQNQLTLQQLARTVDENLKVNRETANNSFRDFIGDQRTRFDDLKNIQREIGADGFARHDQLRNTIERQLESLLQLTRTDAQLNRETLQTGLQAFSETFHQNIDSFNELQKEKFSQLELKQTMMMTSNEKKLEEMRVTVDEKLEKTLQERLGQSFEMVSRQLDSVHKGLGEMQALANDVGGLKKVLGNVKMRGGIGEVQLGMLLEQLLAPDQYAANVKTKQGSADLVEFAIKLPGRDEASGIVYLPIDAKFPNDVYEQLLHAYENAEVGAVESATKNLDQTIKKMARSIRDKYIDPPNTTDFAIMFLPFEAIYADVIRRASLLDTLQREYKVMVTGPTTLAAILNSLQMGFRTLALQQRSSEVWRTLGAVKTEFSKFSGLMEKAQKSLHTATSQIDELVGTRTRAINRKLQNVTALPVAEAKEYLPEITERDLLEEE